MTFRIVLGSEPVEASDVENPDVVVVKGWDAYCDFVRGRNPGAFVEEVQPEATGIIDATGRVGGEFLD